MSLKLRAVKACAFFWWSYTTVVLFENGPFARNCSAFRSSVPRARANQSGVIGGMETFPTDGKPSRSSGNTSPSLGNLSVPWKHCHPMETLSITWKHHQISRWCFHKMETFPSEGYISIRWKRFHPMETFPSHGNTMGPASGVSMRWKHFHPMETFPSDGNVSFRWKRFHLMETPPAQLRNALLSSFRI